MRHICHGASLCLTALYLVAFTAFSSVTNAQTPSVAPTPLGCSPSVASLKRIARQAWATTHDETKVLAALDAAIKSPSAAFVDFIDSPDGLFFTVQSPAQAYRYAVSEALRKRNPIESADAINAIAIDVTPTQIDAPNIEKVLVERNGQLVAPLTSSLQPRVMTTRLGGKEVINGGRLTYSCSSFFPGATVVVTGIPSVGVNMVRSFDEESLEALTGRPAPTPIAVKDLIGKTSSRVAGILPEPITRSGARARFHTRSGEALYVHYSPYGIVESVSNASILIADVVPPPEPPPAPTTAPPAGTPSTAVGRCQDGTTIYTRRNSPCIDNGWVAAWYDKSLSPPPEPRPVVAPRRETTTPAGPTLGEQLLLGKSQAAVRDMLGDPTVVEQRGNTWIYDGDGGSLRIEFAARFVSSIRPAEFDVVAARDALKNKRAARLTAEIEARKPKPVVVPGGAVARCGDNSFVFKSTGKKTCSRNKGVAEWYVRP